MKPIVLDTETTGTDHQTDQIIEAAWLSLPEHLEDFQAAALEHYPCFRSLYRPSVEISLGAMAVHAILPEDLIDAPDSSEFSLPPNVSYLIGHNVDFDWRMAGAPEIPRICTLALSRYLFPELDSHTQSAMLYHFHRAERERCREMVRNAHSALDDVVNCTRLLGHLLAHVGQVQPGLLGSWDAVWRLSETARVPTVMPYGKHKGTPINQVPSDYKSWLLRQPDVDPYLVQALRQR
ncbi:TPA: DNA polymerase III subunit epsilon [Pseudomonas aeruginosa]|nr:DNA polymerase III subunit epsilon [Pseudomonas aeruginosa]